MFFQVSVQGGSAIFYPFPLANALCLGLSPPSVVTVTLPPVTAKGQAIHVSHLSLDELVILWNSAPLAESQSEICDGP